MADALFFYMDQHCNQFRGTQHIEPAKIAWLEVVLGQDTELVRVLRTMVPGFDRLNYAQSIVIQQHLPSLYDAASIPYTVSLYFEFLSCLWSKSISFLVQ